MSPEKVLNFWFEELKPKDWFIKDIKLDRKIKDQFQKVHTQAKQGELWQWRSNARSALAEVIILDQLSRNIYRNKPESFAGDPMALTLAQVAIAKELHKELKTQERAFLYMPFMHSESLVIHEEAVKLFQEPGMENNLDFEYRHKKIIERFGRYPHRNEILGRESSPEELKFLQEPGSSF